jgi:uncharacterized protein YecE (DUF72 family)
VGAEERAKMGKGPAKMGEGPAKRARGRIHVGTSGWAYAHWDPSFYPEHTPTDRRLAVYAGRLPTVEIDATFYRLPSEHAVSTWREEVGPDFVFAVKGSRSITHFRRLTGTDEAVGGFAERLSMLGEKLHVMLWQLPPDLTADTALLDRFLTSLPKGVRQAVEFRHASWLVPETFGVLRAHGVAHVHVSSDEMPVDLTPTADFVYVRFHGTAEYHGSYTHPALEPWADFLRQQAAAGRDGYVYFNNDFEGHAPRDAARLIGMLGEAASRAQAPDPGGE